MQDDTVGFVTLTSALLLVILKEEEVEQFNHLTKAPFVLYDYIRPTHDSIHLKGLSHLPIAELEASILLDHFGCEL